MKLADFSLNNKIKNSNVNFIAHAKYFLFALVAVLISAVFVVSFVGFKADVDYAGGTTLTVVTSEDINNEEVFNNFKSKIDALAEKHNVEISSYEKAETAFGKAIVAKILNKDALVNDAIVAELNEDLNYDSNDILEKNYVTANIFEETASYQTKMASVALSVVIVLAFVYLLFRYNLTSALIYLITALCEIISVLAFTIICRITVSFPFCTAIIATFAISTIFKLIFFGELKQINKIDEYKTLSKHDKLILADKKSFIVLALICIIAVIACVLIAGLGSLQMRAFAIPTLIGAIISALSTFYAVPYLFELINLKK